MYYCDLSDRLSLKKIPDSMEWIVDEVANLLELKMMMIYYRQQHQGKEAELDCLSYLIDVL